MTTAGGEERGRDGLRACSQRDVRAHRRRTRPPCPLAGAGGEGGLTRSRRRGSAQRDCGDHGACRREAHPVREDSRIAPSFRSPGAACSCATAAVARTAMRRRPASTMSCRAVAVARTPGTTSCRAAAGATTSRPTAPSPNSAGGCAARRVRRAELPGGFSAPVAVIRSGFRTSTATGQPGSADRLTNLPPRSLAAWPTCTTFPPSNRRPQSAVARCRRPIWSSTISPVSSASAMRSAPSSR